MDSTPLLSLLLVVGVFVVLIRELAPSRASSLTSLNGRRRLTPIDRNATSPQRGAIVAAAAGGNVAAIVGGASKGYLIAAFAGLGFALLPKLTGALLGFFGTGFSIIRAAASDCTRGYEKWVVALVCGLILVAFLARRIANLVSLGTLRAERSVGPLAIYGLVSLCQLVVDPASLSDAAQSLEVVKGTLFTFLLVAIATWAFAPGVATSIFGVAVLVMTVFFDFVPYRCGRGKTGEISTLIFCHVFGFALAKSVKGKHSG